jgi:hypothetical protein
MARPLYPDRPTSAPGSRRRTTAVPPLTAEIRAFTDVAGGARGSLEVIDGRHNLIYDHVVGGADRLGGLPVGAQGGDVLWSGRGWRTGPRRCLRLSGQRAIRGTPWDAVSSGAAVDRCGVERRGDGLRTAGQDLDHTEHHRQPRGQHLDRQTGALLQEHTDQGSYDDGCDPVVSSGMRAAGSPTARQGSGRAQRTTMADVEFIDFRALRQLRLAQEGKSGGPKNMTR